jgi:hypothetical protein
MNYNAIKLSRFKKSLIGSRAAGRGLAISELIGGLIGLFILFHFIQHIYFNFIIPTYIFKESV